MIFIFQTSKPKPLAPNNNGQIFKTKSFHHLTRLSKHDPPLPPPFTDFAVFPTAISCVDFDDDSLLEKVLSLILNLDDDNKVGLVAEGIVAHLVAITGGSSDFQVVAVTMMTSWWLWKSTRQRSVNKATIGP